VSLLIPKNQIQVFQKDTIIKLGVEMLGIINKQGRMLESIGFDSLGMSKSKKEMFLMKIALRNSMQSDFDEDLGKVNYCMTQREDRKFISIPSPNNSTILAVIKNDCDYTKLVKDITQTLKYSEQFLNEKFQKVVNL